MVSADDIWLGDWKAKIGSRIRALGFHSVADFARSFPSLPYLKLARLLGEDVAAAQLALLHFEEAKVNGRLRETAQDALCRTIHRHLKRGWKTGIYAESNTAGAYAEWLALLEFRALLPHLLPIGNTVWNCVEQLNPPVGWLPSGPNDPIVAMAFEKGWPAKEVDKA